MWCKCINNGFNIENRNEKSQYPELGYYIYNFY